jgi:hypothetical protein
MIVGTTQLLANIMAACAAHTRGTVHPATSRGSRERREGKPRCGQRRPCSALRNPVTRLASPSHQPSDPDACPERDPASAPFNLDVLNQPNLAVDHESDHQDGPQDHRQQVPPPPHITRGEGASGHQLMPAQASLTRFRLSAAPDGSLRLQARTRSDRTERTAHAIKGTLLSVEARRHFYPRLTPPGKRGCLPSGKRLFYKAITEKRGA